MSYAEALQDNIPIDKDVRGFTRYRPPCAVCGVPIASWSYRRDVKYMCAKCRNAAKEGRYITQLLSAKEKSAHKITCVHSVNVVE